MIMQALDYLYLHETRNCILQCAGSDQWGNITAGIDLIRKKTGHEVYGFTMPLVTDKNGKKIRVNQKVMLYGLIKIKHLAMKFYQYLLNSDDEKVIDYLKIYTFLTKEEIENIVKQQEESQNLE